MFEDRLQREILGLKQEVITEAGKVCNEDVYDLYSSPKIIWVLKSR